jgi:hypothetical protein
MSETREQRVIRKAGEIRKALILSGVVFSPDPDLPFTDLAPSRQAKWLRVAETYVTEFPGRW